MGERFCSFQIKTQNALMLALKPPLPLPLWRRLPPLLVPPLPVPPLLVPPPPSSVGALPAPLPWRTILVG